MRASAFNKVCSVFFFLGKYLTAAASFAAGGDSFSDSTYGSSSVRYEIVLIVSDLDVYATCSFDP